MRPSYPKMFPIFYSTVLPSIAVNSAISTDWYIVLVKYDKSALCIKAHYLPIPLTSNKSKRSLSLHLKRPNTFCMYTYFFIIFVFEFIVIFVFLLHFNLYKLAIHSDNVQFCPLFFHLFIGFWLGRTPFVHMAGGVRADKTVISQLYLSFLSYLYLHFYLNLYLYLYSYLYFYSYLNV